MREIVEQILAENGFKLYDIEITEENGHNYYRIYMQKEGSDKSVTLDDCALINRIVSPIFDVEYNSDDSYFLEVSSPGVERTLTKPEHFEKSVGEYKELFYLRVSFKKRGVSLVNYPVNLCLRKLFF